VKQPYQPWWRISLNCIYLHTSNTTRGHDLKRQQLNLRKYRVNRYACGRLQSSANELSQDNLSC